MFVVTWTWLSTPAGAVVRNDDLPHIQQPLISFFERIVGPQDLYGFLTSRNSVKDLVLAQKTSVTIEQIRDLWRARAIDRDDADVLLDNCSCGPNVIGQACRDMIEALKPGSVPTRRTRTWETWWLSWDRCGRSARTSCWPRICCRADALTIVT